MWGLVQYTGILYGILVLIVMGLLALFFTIFIFREELSRHPITAQEVALICCAGILGQLINVGCSYLLSDVLSFWQYISQIPGVVFLWSLFKVRQNLKTRK